MSLGSPRLLHPATSFNLLGAPEANGTPTFRGLDVAAKTPGAAVHLYGKRSVKPYRKMGHVTVTGTTRLDAQQKAAVVVLRLVVREPRCERVPEVQRAGGRRGETDPDHAWLS